MNALAEMPRIQRATVVSERRRAEPLPRYWIGLLAAIGIHVAILFAWPRAKAVIEPPEFGVEMADASVEVALVAALPAEEPTPDPPEPEPPAMVEPPPIVPTAPPEIVLPEPEPVPPLPRDPPKSEAPAAPKPQPRPKPAVRSARAAGDGSSVIPGESATSAVASAGAISAKPGYLRNPHPAYPEAARAARQQGLVMLLVKVDAQGGVAAVRVARSSGFPLLDERARSTVSQRWKFRPAKAAGLPVPSEVTVPVRFQLD